MYAQLCSARLELRDQNVRQQSKSPGFWSETFLFSLSAFVMASVHSSCHPVTVRTHRLVIFGSVRGAYRPVNTLKLQSVEAVVFAEPHEPFPIPVVTLKPCDGIFRMSSALGLSTTQPYSSALVQLGISSCDNYVQHVQFSQ
jgi:hypothetical protein